MQIGGIGDVPESGRFNAKIARKRLFANPVLSGMKRGLTRAGKTMFGQKGHRACWYILKFTSNRVNFAGKGGKRHQIIIASFGTIMRDITGRAVGGVRGKNMGSKTKLAGSNHQHPAKLSTAKNANGFLRSVWQWIIPALRQHYRSGFAAMR